MLQSCGWGGGSWRTQMYWVRFRTALWECPSSGTHTRLRGGAGRSMPRAESMGLSAKASADPIGTEAEVAVAKCCNATLQAIRLVGSMPVACAAGITGAAGIELSPSTKDKLRQRHRTHNAWPAGLRLHAIKIPSDAGGCRATTSRSEAPIDRNAVACARIQDIQDDDANAVR